MKEQAALRGEWFESKLAYIVKQTQLRKTLADEAHAAKLSRVAMKNQVGALVAPCLPPPLRAGACALAASRGC